MVEVLHDHSEALVLLADEVLQRHFHSVELHVGRATRPDALTIHPLRRDPRPLLQEQHGNAPHARAASADSRGEEVREDLRL